MEAADFFPIFSSREDTMGKHLSKLSSLGSVVFESKDAPTDHAETGHTWGISNSPHEI